MTDAYHFEGDTFVIEQYNDRTPFAGFLPGIAGTRGRPAWVFYVNRGQAIASFGVRNKDGAFLEFFPADKAYQLTPSRGFRTFLKVFDGDRTLTHEPFQRGFDAQVHQRMLVSPHEVGVEEVHPGLGLRMRADLFTLPEAPVAGLVRRVEIENLSGKALKIEIVDGLPQVLAYGLNQWGVKFMSRTSEAFMRVEGVENDLPFYRLKVWPSDTPQVEPVIPGNFFAGFANGRRNRAIVDPERIFGLAGDFSRPERFFSAAPLDRDNQVVANRTPSAFQTLTIELQPGQSRVFYGLYGQARSQEALDRFVAIEDIDGYFEDRREINRRLIDGISKRAFTATAMPAFDAHVRQCYLDNGLRGGFPAEVPGGALLYLFGRKHGDLERDYNDFLLQDTPYSEGNGDFRDVLQNRRMDLFFEPAIDAKNIRYFFNLIQPDGYNPCSLRNSRFYLDKPERFEPLFGRFQGLDALLAREFKYAELWHLMENSGEAFEPILAQILREAREVEDAEFDRGYWSDHWTYLVDLLIGYEAVFPDRLAALFCEKTFTFFDPTHAVVPRAGKYAVTPQGIRQFGAVESRPDKKDLIESRRRCRYQVRAEYGRGDIVYTTLTGKILTLIVNKLATLDPCGAGIEMEADRPGWCDALNGLPGIFGSAVNETIELKRLVDFTTQTLAETEAAVLLPAELADFLIGLNELIQRSNLSPAAYWQASGALKEGYRDRVFMGFEGGERELTAGAVRQFLNAATRFLDAAIARARTPEGITTYFSYEAEAYRETGEGKAEVDRFRQKPLPPFLEGYVHALRIADPGEAKSLYRAAKASDLYDRKLGMYRLNAPLGDALELGRIAVFNYGWLENGSIFLHMHYKFVLEMVRAGLADEFYAEIERLLVAFRDPAEYGRNPNENSSFLVSSGFSADPRQHGRGCVARLSGSTVELLHLWLHLFLGSKPFGFEAGELRFRPAPVLSQRMFIPAAQSAAPFGFEEELPANSAACALFGRTLLVYSNPSRRDTFGENAVKPAGYRLYAKDGTERSVATEYLAGEEAASLRRGDYRRVDVMLA